MLVTLAVCIKCSCNCCLTDVIADLAVCSAGSQETYLCTSRMSWPLFNLAHSHLIAQCGSLKATPQVRRH